ncbi:erythromycin esterase family protein [Streptomyces sp. NPDC091272]|uniref:erythromycin esterase family protein n=1 Tax=Streptomyces sp. NPDC091272 TaxID=3365981 RepID=UPI003808EED7
MTQQRSTTTTPAPSASAPSTPAPSASAPSTPGPAAPAPAAPAPSASAPSGSLPLPDSALDQIADSLGGATVVGIGESTRFSRETFGIRDQIFRRLVRRHGFRALAWQDGAGVAERLDRYVRLGEGDAVSALADAWQPWRSAETVAALEWLRGYNEEHPGDPVRIFGVQPVKATTADYDAVLERVREVAPERLAEVAAHLEPIKTAHRTDEHVQRAHGTHPGRPFAEHARDALALVRALPGGRKDGGALARMRLIVDFHERSVAGSGSFSSDVTATAEVVAAHQRETGLRIAYWDGIAHTSAAPITFSTLPGQAPAPTVGSELRRAYGEAGYLSVAIGFHHGDLGIVRVPEPAAGQLDARLAEAPEHGEQARAAHWLDLRQDEVRDNWDGPVRARVISGVYDPAHDADHHLAVASAADAFDLLIHVREVTPVRWLP